MVQGLITIQVRVDTRFHFLFCPLQVFFWLCFCLKCKKEHICLFLCVSVVSAYICVHPLCVFVCAHVLWIFMHSWACMYIYVISAHLHGYSGLSSCFFTSSEWRIIGGFILLGAVIWFCCVQWNKMLPLCFSLKQYPLFSVH